MKPSTTLNRWLALAVLATSGLAQAGSPAPTPVTIDPTPSGEGWSFRAAPYGWLTAVEGDVTVGHLTTPVDISMADTLESVDMTFMGLFEVSYNRWSLGVDLIYGKLSQDIDGGGHLFDSFRFEQKQLFVIPAVSYRVIDNENYHMSIYAGARVTAMEVELTGRFARGGETTSSVDESWIDPLVGIRGQADLSDRWFFRYAGDIGGFGVNSDLIWNAFAGLGYNVNDSVGLILGYRALGMDYTQGAFTMDVVSHGPVMGLEVRF
jgi:opacity protein-like surface antigen